MKFCPECGTKTLSDSSKFCAECGTKFTIPSAPSVKEITRPKIDLKPKSSIKTRKSIPDAATGEEAKQLYKDCIARVERKNPNAVAEFKSNCKAYGMSQLPADQFHRNLVKSLGQSETNDFIPQLVRLIPSAEKRAELMQFHTAAPAENGLFGVASPSSSTSSEFRGVGMGAGKSNPEAKTGVLSRYADHPKCDICNTGFEVAKRRHQCRSCGLYVCSTCSPLKLLIPPGHQIDGAKKYDPSQPQRVCIQCAPKLQGRQDELARKYGQYNTENPHEAKGRIHAPYSSSLEKECRNAADIVGNFFRPSWGASKDRSIPIKFLEKAHGLAVMTVVKAGFLITGKIGTGLVISKLPDGSWSAPSAIGTAGLGGGLEIGGELVEYMIILGSPGAVKVFHKAQLNVGAGLDLAVGPYGRSADAAAAASTSGLNANYSYSQSKGLYAGISLQGAVITARKDVNTKFYGRELTPQAILTGEVEQPRAAKPLYDALERAMSGIEEHQEGKERQIDARGACNACGCSRFVPHSTQVWNKNCKSCKHVH